MNAIQRMVLAAVLLSAASCSNPQACATTAECAESEASRGYVCAAGACAACAADSDCAGEDAYGAGAVCVDGRCAAASCAPGDQGCECTADGGCADGLACSDGVCMAPAVGCEGCPCGADGSCDAGLVCEDDRCAAPPACPEGTDGCPCFAGGTCNGGLSCDAATSTCLPCTPGETMCACDGAGVCGEGLVCEASAMCPPGSTECCVPSSCTEGTLGCPCSTTDPPCGQGAVCRGGLCVCGDNFVGASCEISCTNAQLMLSADPVFNPSADQGFWVCGHFAASDHFEVSTGGYSLQGEVPITPTDRATLRGGTFSVTSR